MQQMKHSHKVSLQREHGFKKNLEEADEKTFTNDVHIYRFYFITLVVVILISIILLIL